MMMGQSLLAFIAFLAYVVYGVKKLDLKGCETTKACHYLHKGQNRDEKNALDCKAETDNCALILTHRKSSKVGKVTVEMQAMKGEKFWGAVAFSEDETMGKDYVVYCDFDSKKVFTGVNRNEPGTKDKKPGHGPTKKIEVLEDKDAKVDKDNGICRFELPVEVPEKIVKELTDAGLPEFKTIKKELNILMSWGTNRLPAGAIGYHGARVVAAKKINFADPFKTDSEKGKETPKKTTKETPEATKTEDTKGNDTKKAPETTTKGAAQTSVAFFSSFLSLATFAIITTLSLC